MKRTKSVRAWWALGWIPCAVTMGVPSARVLTRKIAGMLAALSLVHAAPAGAQDVEEAFQRLASAKSLRCDIGAGGAVRWQSGKPQVKSDRLDVVLHFDAIDHKKRSARLIANAGASDVVVLMTESGLTFVERTQSGNLTFTTVFAEYAPNSRDFIAVHSRHVTGAGLPMPSQYHGACKIWD